MNTTHDIFLINLPWWDVEIPFCATALLKGIAESAGFRTLNHDFTVDLRDYICKKDINRFVGLTEYFVNRGTINEDIIKYYDYIIDVISSQGSNLVGISVFSTWTQRATLDILTLIKARLPNIRVVIGGKGGLTRPHDSIKSYLSPVEQMLTFDQIVKRRKLVDYVVMDSVEIEFIKVLADHTNRVTTIQQLNRNSTELRYPFSNFSDVKFSDYSGSFGKVQIPIVGSEGCVRKCDFCSETYHTPRFKSRSSQDIVDEMIYQSQKHSIVSFAMADSLSNGNLKELRLLCEKLVEYNKSVESSKRIRWSGNWIARPPGQISPDLWDLLAESGFEHATIGAESGSNYVLKNMDKKTTVEGLLYEIHHMRRVGIQVLLNNVLGHWSEEFEHFVEHLNTIVALGPYIASGTITELFLGDGFKAMYDTPAVANTEKNGLILSPEDYTNIWYTKKNPSLTLKARMSRVVIVYELATMLNIPLTTSVARMKVLRERIRQNIPVWNSWYKQIVTEIPKPCQSIQLLDQSEEFLKSLIAAKFPMVNVKVILRANSFNGNPRISISHNGQEILTKDISGIETFSYVAENTYTGENKFSIELLNKGELDTQVDQFGNISSDKNVEFESIEIDGVDILKDQGYFYNQVIFEDSNGQSIKPAPGLYRNGSVTVKFDAPFWQHYLQSRQYNEWRVLNLPDSDEYTQVLNDIKMLIRKFEI